jgi:hypothetical protein
MVSISVLIASVDLSVVTNGWKVFNGLEGARYGHRRIFTAKAYDKESVLPGVHLVVSLMKRVILGIFQGRCEEAYLQHYLDEYVSDTIDQPASTSAKGSY